MPSCKYHWEVSPQDRIFQFIKDYVQEKDHKPFTPDIWDRFEAFDSNLFRISIQYDSLSCGVYIICFVDLPPMKCKTHEEKQFDLTKDISELLHLLW